MSLIQVSHVTFYYDGSSDYIFDDVSFQIDSDWKLGFVGRNGRGKTTFLRMLMGELEYRGKIISSLKFDYFPFPIKDKEKDTIEILDDIWPDYELWKVCRELNLLEVEADILYRPFSALSSGEQTKFMLAVLFSREGNFLLIDEPTNHLDVEGRELVKNYLNRKKGFILVSHDRHFLDGCVDHLLVLNRQDIEVRQGSFSAWWEDKQNRDAFELAGNEKLKKEIGRLKDSMRRTAGWSDQIEKSKIGSHVGDRGYVGHKSAKMMKRAKVIEKRMEESIEEKGKLLKNVEQMDTLKIFPLRHHKEVLVRAEEVSLFVPGKEICAGKSFEVRNGDRILLKGRNGSGKSSMLKAMLKQAGVLESDLQGKNSLRSLESFYGENLFQSIESLEITGKLELASGLKISYVPQDTSGLKGNLREFIRETGLDESLFKALLRQLDFSREQFEKPMEQYSAGQRKKVLLAKSLCEQAHLYIWDEPLNYIDLFSRMQLEELIRERKPTLLFVEHDVLFAENIATAQVCF